MNTLALVRKVCNRAGFERPNSFSALTPEQSDAKEWVQDAWVEIQLSCLEWSFLKKRKEVVVSSGKATYSKTELSLPLLRRWLEGNSFIQETGVGSKKRKITLISHDDMVLFKELDEKIGVPAYYSTDISGTLFLFPTPDKGYLFTANYYEKPTVLEDEQSVPACDDEHHMAIYNLAMHTYSISDNDPELEQQSFADFNVAMSKLDSAHCPQFTMTQKSANCSNSRSW